MTDHPRQTPSEIYAFLWNAALPAFREGHVQIDPHLENRDEDLRRGLTLVLRPGTEIARNALHFLEKLREIEPEQHFYQAEEFHITVLSLLTVSPNSKSSAENLGLYEKAIASAARSCREFKLEFHGITASTDSVMIQGFPADDALNQLRDRIRHDFQAIGLDGEFDQRYRRQAAHMTVVRFRKPLQNRAAFCNFLQEMRDAPFGDMQVQAVQLVENDWYMSSSKVRLLREYQLGS